MEKRVAIIGAGMSGLLATKYVLEKGFNPIVFEAQGGIGGHWPNSIESTRLQNHKGTYQFSDFPWDPSVTDMFPRNIHVMAYFKAYAQHFNIIPHIKFNSRVISMDYVGVSNEEMESWDAWSGTGKPFGSKGTWHLEVQSTLDSSTKEYQFDFIIFCIGRFSGVPNTPEFPPGQGPEVFEGKVIHAMEYSSMDNARAREFIKNKRVTVVGGRKSAADIAVECANANGTKHPCTLIPRTAHWFMPHDYFWGVYFGYFYLNRFAELLLHKPNETLLLGIIATLLAPLKWFFSKWSESYLRSAMPLKKYKMVPECSFHENLSSCQFLMLPDNFYERADEGSLIIKRAQKFTYWKKGLILEGESKPMETDAVIYATGYRGDTKIRNMFKAPTFQKFFVETNTTLRLYREMIHPKIPQLAVIGYSESFSNMYVNEIRCQWLGHFLEGNFELPRVKDMENDVMTWENYMKKHHGRYFRASCMAGIHIWYNDLLCKDMGRNPRRKKGALKDWFEPYVSTDYAGSTHE